ncbi:MAG: cell division protein FtsZ [Candidatus Diapherotrites archaeon]|uniref:Cell division protein FtsZ n=1 Tax=Candidatus Iainarchaeum sp. TaxID=3101447 RepID=A0A497JFM3_9ARCH|nr:cell division protein FtsZ [Candidatus Diapherotrites archaeon]RLG69642.1 MAG: cell division protein FtsZ [Candidatus Diapherotrites archaeon]
MKEVVFLKSIVENAIEKRSLAEDTLEEFGTPKIMVVGTGGAGCNAVNRLANMGITGARLVAVNTDKQHLSLITDEVTKILIGKSVTRGLGAGGYPEIGAKAAEVSRNALEEVLSGVDMLFLTAGMGGGTGTGSAPIIAEIAKEQGAIVISMITYPFALEKARLEKAENGIVRLQETSDTVIVIDNNRLVELVPNLPIQDAFKVADEVIARTVRGITETITQPSLINLDYADVRAVMSNKGLSVIAVGESKSVDKVNEVVEDTLKNALLDVNIEGATGALIHITGGPELTLGEANAVGELLTERIDPKAQVIWGARVDPTFENKMEVISIFTGVTSPYIKGPASTMRAARGASSSLKDLDIEFVR